MQLTEASVSSRYPVERRQDVAHVQPFAFPGTPMAASPLTRACLEIDEYAAGLGWDKPARLFALVDTARLKKQEPRLASQLGVDQDDAGKSSLTPIEQDEVPKGTPSTSSWAPSPGPTRSSAAR